LKGEAQWCCSISFYWRAPCNYGKGIHLPKGFLTSHVTTLMDCHVIGSWSYLTKSIATKSLQMRGILLKVEKPKL